MQLPHLCETQHTQRQRTSEDSHSGIKRLLAEQGFLQEDRPTKEELVSPGHFSPLSFTSTFPELKLNVMTTISVKSKHYLPSNKLNLKVS